MGRLSDLVGRRLYIDSNVFIYALETLSPWDRAAEAVLKLGEDRRSTVVTSALTLAECLVKPFQSGDIRMERVYLRAIRSGGGFEVIRITRRTLIECARLRAANPSIRTPDALHAAAARLHRCDVFITNDRRLKNLKLGYEVELLDDLNG